MTDIAKNIKRLREARNISQQELADIVGVTRPMITQIERGTKTCSMPLGAAIAKALGCSIEQLFEAHVDTAESA